MNEEGRVLKDLLLILTRPLVDHPDSICVEVSDQGHRVFLSLTCAPNDMGKIIGRGGKRAQAIRTLMKARALRLNCRVSVDFAG